MSDTLKTVDLSKELVSFGGFTIDGWASGDAMTIDIPPDYIYTPGGDGDATLSRTGDRSVVVKLRLVRGSIVHALLSGIRILGIKAGNGAGIGTFQYEDAQGGTRVTGQAVIEQAPSLQIGETPGPREWTLRVHNPEIVIGSN